MSFFICGIVITLDNTFVLDNYFHNRFFIILKIITNAKMATMTSKSIINMLSESPPGFIALWISNGNKLKALAPLNILSHKNRVGKINAITTVMIFALVVFIII